jgi:serine/threonine protein kinase
MIRTLHPETGTYKITEFLGEGALGRVYKALKVDSREFSQQIVALKILKSQNQVQFLIREMETLLKVRSTYCASLLGWENTEAGPAIVMEWVDGVSLEVLCRHLKIETELVREVAWQIQEGLRDLEGLGLCHGDLSPSNILIDTKGNVRLVDFGLSGDLKSMAGTPKYMAPERWQNHSAKTKSDLFSLGLIVHDLDRGVLFDSAPTEYWKMRLDQLIDSNIWLAKEPDQRSYLEIKQNLSAKRGLAELVAQCQLQRKIVSRTAGQSNHFKVSSFCAAKTHASFSMFALLAVFLFPLAPFGQSSRYYSSLNSSIEIRTIAWYQIRLGLAELGYTPVVKTELPPGLHRIIWKSKNKTGTNTISLGYGEHKMLTDRDFIQK